MVEANHSDEEIKNETFVDSPAILEKYKAAAVIADGKCLSTVFVARLGSNYGVLCRLRHVQL